MLPSSSSRDARQGSLGTITGIVTPTRRGSSKSCSHGADQARVKRFALQSAAGELLPDERVCWCCKRIIKGKQAVKLLYSPQHEAAFFGDVMTCGSPWVCPVCAAKIAERRRIELRRALVKGHELGLTPIMITFTLRHHAGDSLACLVGALNEAFRRVKNGKGWKLFSKRHGLGHYVTALEVTYGRSGWHPHKHMLIWSDQKAGKLDYYALRGWISERYQAILGELGYDASDFNGVVVSVGDANAGNYVMKWGLDCELAKANIKRSRAGLSPFQLLELAWLGGAGASVYPDLAWVGNRARGLFLEYAEVMKGRNQLVWSKGARDYFGLGDEITDEELASRKEEDAIILMFLTWEQWKLVLKHDIRGEVINAARTGDALRVLSLFDRFGIRYFDGQWYYALRERKALWGEYMRHEGGEDLTKAVLY